MKIFIYLGFTLFSLLPFISTYAQLNIDFNKLNEEQCLYFENNSNRMLLKCTNNSNTDAYFQIITPGTSPAYYLFAVRFIDSRFFDEFSKIKFYSDGSGITSEDNLFSLVFKNSQIELKSAPESEFEKKMSSGGVTTLSLYLFDICKDKNFSLKFKMGEVVDKYGNIVNSTTNSNINNAPSNNYNNSQPYGRSRASIELDLKKAYELLSSMEANKARDKSAIDEIQYNRMIVNQKKRIEELKAELRNANH